MYRLPHPLSGAPRRRNQRHIFASDAAALHQGTQNCADNRRLARARSSGDNGESALSNRPYCLLLFVVQRELPVLAVEEHGPLDDILRQFANVLLTRHLAQPVRHRLHRIPHPCEKPALFGLGDILANNDLPITFRQRLACRARVLSPARAHIDRLVVPPIIVILHPHGSLQQVWPPVNSEERIAGFQRKLHRCQEQIHARGLGMQMLRDVACGLHVRKRQRASRENACEYIPDIFRFIAFCRDSKQIQPPSCLLNCHGKVPLTSMRF